MTEAMIAQKVDLLFFSPLDPIALSPMVKKAQDAGIP